ncbi:hypothetical protein [Luteococcus sp.]|uniref:hypothetical protein n=1 Tax=Luteococcus sp. TaxID=1969402 RepID=UPI003734C24C
MPRRSIHTARLTALAICCLAPLTMAATARAGDNDVQGLGPVGTATMHGDAQSSDTTIHPGPGHGPLRSTFRAKAAACPTILADSQGRIWSLCTEVFGRAPVVNLLDPATGATLASLPITKGALLGGVYAYLDDADRLVLVDGTHRLRRIAASTDVAGRARLSTAASLDLSAFVTATGSTPTDAVVGLVPDRRGHVWLATREGKVGVLDPASGAVSTVALPSGERIDNSISASPRGVAVATSHALYLLDDADGTPTIRWRRAYDRGTARKPGQLSWGTGATPTFLGPDGSDEYLTITDNADGQEHLLVLRTADGSTVCEPAIFRRGASGTENSAMGHGRSIIVASTYGYPYPALPEGAGRSVPSSAQFTVGGMERWEVTPDGSGCNRRWSRPVLSAAVPRWSLADDTIYTIERPAPLGITGTIFNAVSIDASTGATTSRTAVGWSGLRDSLQMVGTITPQSVWWQGTMTGVLRMDRKG